MVLAYHLIFCMYGFWLPNDPRGSWSNEVWAKDLRPFGEATKTTARRSVAGAAHDQAARLAAKAALLFPPVVFDPAQMAAAADGFADIIATMRIQILACAIMPDHVHMVVARHGELIETLAGYLKRTATRRLNKTGLNPQSAFTDRRGRVPTPWAEHGWWRFLDSPEAIATAVEYVERNPIKVGLPAQRWDFVTAAAPRHV